MGLGRMLGVFVMCLFITIQQTAAKSCVLTFDDCEGNTAKGKYYFESVSKTKSGYTCKNWKKTKGKYSFVGNHNFCRNPSASSHVWCYTTSPKKSWEYCDILYYKSYSGSVSKTKSGYTCKNWQKTSYSFVGNHNFCRNPSDSSHVWCYTTSPKKSWEYCDIPSCDKTMEMEKRNITKEACMTTCKETTISFGDCESKTKKGRDYTGTLSKTKSGLTCQKWTSQTPHKHSYKVSGDHNYCRNPTGSGSHLWCFTTDSTKRWEYCDVPICDKSLVNLKMKKAYTTCINNPECEKCTSIIKKLLPTLLKENIIQEGEVGVLGSPPGASTFMKKWATTYTLIKGDDIITKRTNNELVTINATKNDYVGKRYYGTTSRRLTGLYAGPGDIVTITFPKEVVGKISLGIGHTIIKMDFWLGCSVCKIGSPWGGLIVLFVHGTSLKGEFTIKVDNAIKAASYVLGQTNNELWNQELKKYSPKWAELRVPGQVNIFVQLLKIKGITDMEATMTRIKETMDLLEDMIGLPPGSRPGAENVGFKAAAGGVGLHYFICRPGWAALGDSLYNDEYDPKSTYYDDFFLKTGTNRRFLHELGHGYCYGDLTGGAQWVAENVKRYIEWKKGVVDEKYKIFMESPDLDFYLLHRMVAFDLFSYGKPCEEAKFNKKQLYEGAYDMCTKWINWVPERIHGWDVWRAINTLNAKSKRYNWSKINNWDNMMDLYCKATKHNMLPLFNLYNIQPSNETITSNCRKLPQSDILTKWLAIISCVKQSMMDGSKDIRDCSKLPNFPEHKGLCVISGVCHEDQAYGGKTTNMENKFDLYGSDKKKSSDNKQKCFKRAEDYFKDCKNDKEEKITAKFYGKELGNDDSFTYPSNCECKTQKCQDYTGTLSKTKSGYTCQKWTSQTPHKHSYTESGDHNYCRNPSGSGSHLWCYTTDSNKRWEYCCY